MSTNNIALRSNLRILIVGSGARENAIIKALFRSEHSPLIYCYGNTINPDIRLKSTELRIGDINNPQAVLEFALQNQIDIALVGPENPSEAGVGDILKDNGIVIVSPTKSQAILEWSKTFTRDLLTKHQIDGSPMYKSFDSLDGVVEFIESMGTKFVIKADGLCGGKGVQVQDDHFGTLEEGLKFCREIVKDGGSFLIEEKLEGQEFSYFAISDGANLKFLDPIIQDHKRAYEGDKGPNTGGMGTYSCEDHLLPFLTIEDKAQAATITKNVFEAMTKDGIGFVGVMYGGFMKTRTGVKLIEYNARFGDPECENLFSLLESDWVEVMVAMANQTLDKIEIKFSPKASVCKYVVPTGYPDKPVKGEIINIDEIFASDNLEEDWESMLFASVDELEDESIILKGSRAIAICCTGENTSEAEAKVENIIAKISGPIFHRADIGRSEYIATKVTMMEGIMK
jgi:phosphoribosylamine--glycine ligase